MSKRFFVIAGEASGDVLGAGVMSALQARGAREIAGIGGPLMEGQGLQSLIPMKDIAVMGIAEVVLQLPRLLKLIGKTVEEIEKQQPDILLTIDLPDFNFQVAKRLKKRGIFKGKIIHYVAPTVWAWRPGRAKKIAGFLDGLMCLFPFEPAYFTPHGLKATYVGHPIIEQDANIDSTTLRKLYEFGPDEKILGLYLGSREGEIKTHFEELKNAVQFLQSKFDNLQVIIPTLPDVEFQVRQVCGAAGLQAIIITDPKQKWQAMAACDVAVAVSGTVGLELAYMNVPHVIGYKTSLLTYWAIRLLVKVKHAHLANILLDRAAVPEFLQGKFSAINIAKALYKLLKTDEATVRQRTDFEALRAKLREEISQSPSQQAADYILSS